MSDSLTSQQVKMIKEFLTRDFFYLIDLHAALGVGTDSKEHKRLKHFVMKEIRIHGEKTHMRIKVNHTFKYYKL